VTQTYLSPQATTAPFTSREASAAGRLRPNAVTVHVEFGLELVSQSVVAVAASGTRY
jgi:hypothetical protein